jgi:anti-anti-sigma regulatory factor
MAVRQKRMFSKIFPAAVFCRAVKYRITEINGWIIVHPSGKDNNEPLRVKYLFKKGLTQQGVRVIVNLKDLSQFGVWEVGLITSFKKEVDQRAGTLRLCNLNASLKGCFQGDRFAEQFESYPDLESAMSGERNENG